MQHLQKLKAAGAAGAVNPVAQAQNALAMEHQLEMQKNAQEIHYDAQETKLEHQQDAMELALERQYLEALMKSNAARGIPATTTTTNGAATTAAINGAAINGAATNGLATAHNNLLLEHQLEIQ
mmetsp:Transcript_22229/g.21463  ORF Transcript_22229/g.21463 Transcript_22229/m.21463 type:complete len:124 (+) Transcript_22229:633-1004(+)